MDTDSETTVRDRLAAVGTGRVLLGVAYAAAGIALYAGLVLDWFRLFTGGVVAVGVLLVVSIALSLRADGLATRENAVTAGAVVVAVGLLVGLTTYTSLPDTAVFVIVFVVGVFLPQFLVRRIEEGDDVRTDER